MLLILLTSGIGVYATANYLAKQVDYNRDESKIKNVEEALNDLYSKVSTQNLGTYETDYLPSDKNTYTFECDFEPNYWIIQCTLTGGSINTFKCLNGGKVYHIESGGEYSDYFKSDENGITMTYSNSYKGAAYEFWAIKKEE